MDRRQDSGKITDTLPPPCIVWAVGITVTLPYATLLPILPRVLF